MITIDVADLVLIAGQVLGTGPKAALDQLDIAAAHAALAMARPSETSHTGAEPTDTPPADRQPPEI
jgi:hypothetical protein